jgi:hypothetical protein
VRKAMKDNGLERFGFSSHSLRHSFLPRICSIKAMTLHHQGTFGTFKIERPWFICTFSKETRHTLFAFGFLLNEIEWAAKVFQEAAKGFNEYSKGVLINYRAVIPPKWAIIACVVI